MFGGNADTFAYDFNHFYNFGAQSTTHVPYLPVFTPAEMWSIDKKFDDGRPGLGNIFTLFWDTYTTAANQTDNANAEYLTTDSFECAPQFIQNF